MDVPTTEEIEQHKETLQAAARVLKENNGYYWDCLFSYIGPDFEPQCWMAMGTIVQELLTIAYNAHLMKG